MNEIKIARKAINEAIARNEICKEMSGMHRVAINAIIDLCKNYSIANELAWHAAKDVYLNN